MTACQFELVFLHCIYNFEVNSSEKIDILSVLDIILTPYLQS